jgi:hypothetical protein
MDRAPITFPAWRASPEQDPLERERVEIDAAMQLVLSGVATRVRVANLSRPEAAAAQAAASASGLPIRVRFERGDGTGRTVCIERADADEPADDPEGSP